MKKFDQIRHILAKDAEMRTKKDVHQILVPFMENIELFRNLKLKKKELIEVCTGLQYETCSRESTVINYGDFGDKYFIILKGQVSVWYPKSS